MKYFLCICFLFASCCISKVDATIVRPEWYYDAQHIKADAPVYLLEDKNPAFQDLIKERCAGSKQGIIEKFTEKILPRHRLRFSLVGVAYDVSLKEMTGHPVNFMESTHYEEPTYEWVQDILDVQNEQVMEKRNALFVSFWEDKKGKNLFCNFLYTTDPRLANKSVIFLNDLELLENEAPIGSTYEYFSGRFRIHKKDASALQKAAFFRRHTLEF